MLVLYSFCLLLVIGLGWFGGRLVYGEKVMEISKNYQVGERIFLTNCNICHANGGNKITPEQPLRNSDDLENFKTFLSLIRTPEKLMPSFKASQISDKEAKALYDYIVNEINCPPGGSQDFALTSEIIDVSGKWIVQI
ncbi:MAG: c-type cytochrome [Smithellaceae bacterium]